MSIRACLFSLLLFLAAVTAVSGQEEARPMPPRLWLNGWTGLFTNMGGFSDGQNEFYQFDDDEVAFGGGIHFDTRAGIVIGVEGLYTKPGYVLFDRQQVEPISEDDATVLSGLLSARFSAGGGPLGIYFGGGVGVFQWDVPDLGEKNRDLALNANVGVEYALFRRAPFFAEYGQWWVYHEKEEVQTNTARHNLLRVGIRAGLL
jgi:hypothetical protein